MKKLIQFSVLLMLFSLCASVFAPVANAGFRFVVWADTRGVNTTLARLSNQVKALPVQPALTIYPGDLIPTNGNTSILTRFQLFQNALDGGNSNGIAAKTFPSRGNHDLPDTATWLSFFQMGPLSDPNSVAAKVGVTNYAALNEDLTYSFDYQNSHFVAVDVAGNANLMTAAQIAWTDQDLRSAASRGIKHAFIYWHGPLYTINGHQAPIPTAVASMLNNHPIITALFYGHEHVLGHTTLDKSRVPQFTNLVTEQFVSGGGGATLYGCTAGRSDFCLNAFGFMTVDVLSDTQFRATFYKDGVTTPIFDRVYTKGQIGPPTGTPPPTLPPTVPPSGGVKVGDVNNDGKVNIIDIGIVIDNYGKLPIPNPKADVNKDGVVNIVDIGLLIDNYTM